MGERCSCCHPEATRTGALGEGVHGYDLRTVMADNELSNLLRSVEQLHQNRVEVLQRECAQSQQVVADQKAIIQGLEAKLGALQSQLLSLQSQHKVWCSVVECPSFWDNYLCLQVTVEQHSGLLSQNMLLKQRFTVC